MSNIFSFGSLFVVSVLLLLTKVWAMDDDMLVPHTAKRQKLNHSSEDIREESPRTFPSGVITLSLKELLEQLPRAQVLPYSEYVKEHNLLQHQMSWTLELLNSFDALGRVSGFVTYASNFGITPDEIATYLAGKFKASGTAEHEIHNQVTLVVELAWARDVSIYHPVPTYPGEMQDVLFSDTDD